MNLLLDSHVFVWQGVETGRIGPIARMTLQDAKNDLFLSIAGIWELAIKDEVGKLELPVDLQLFVATMLKQRTISLLPLTPDHAFELRNLDRLHKDPFDRILVAQARVENMTLVTADERLFSYPVRTLDARK